MKNWRSLITSISRTTLIRAAVVLGVAGSALGSYAGLGLIGGTVPFAEAMNLPAALAVLPDPLSIMTARSPGERGHGAMFNIKQTKHPRQLASNRPRSPRERVLSNVRERDPVGGVPAGDLPITPAGFVPDLSPVTPDALGPVGPGGGGDSFGPPPVFPTGPGGNIPGVPGPTPTPTPTTPVPAVPEPATWAMMSLGFAITGLAVRRRKRTRATVA
ncbi:MAG: PEPxxWA-CTERM sorting domain-containing protein [Sphingomonas phyllosphaerae]|uniref:PEPxxWA-CTERM sorting domain-containing protein n=1 Tax=Sphingomonas phyllosphaerae TaxID=257003 RepID=UPI002FF62006